MELGQMRNLSSNDMQASRFEIELDHPFDIILQ